MTNTVVLVGDVGADLITRATQGGNVTSLSVATERRWDTPAGEAKKETERHKVTCFNGLDTNVRNYVYKGSKVSVQGRLHYTKWTDKDGTERYGVEVIVETVDFLTKAPGAAHNGQED